MELKQLEYFLTIYEEGSISKAADKLFISQQGLSKAVLALEKELDCKLFDRNPKGVVLTEAGNELLLHAYKITEAKSALVRDMLKFREHEKLSVDMVIGSRFSMPKGLFQGLHKKYPNMEIEVNERVNEACMYNLEHGRTDLAIVIQPEKKAGYVYDLIKREALTIVMPAEHPFAKKKELYLADLDGLEITFHSGSSSFIFLEACSRQGIRFEKTVEAPGMPALYQTCSERGILGISLGSMEGIFQFPNLVSVPIRLDDAAWDITLVYHESAKKRKPVRDFLEYWKDRRI